MRFRVSMMVMLSILFGLFTSWAIFAQEPRQVVPLQEVERRKGEFKLAEDAFLGGNMQNNAFTLFISNNRWFTSETEFTLNKRFDLFVCLVAMDDKANTDASREVRILLNGELAYRESVKTFSQPKAIKLDVKSTVRMTLLVEGNEQDSRVLFINPQLIQGTPPTQIVCAQCGQVFPTQTALNEHVNIAHRTTISTQQNIPANFSIDPKDLDTLANSFRTTVDGEPTLKQRIDNGNVALMTFTLIDIPSASIATNVAEDFSTALIQKHFSLIERGQLDKVLKELEIQDSAMIDPATANKIGQLTGCDLIIVGSISDRDQFVVINARLLDTATGRALVANRVEMRKIPIIR